jgi:hypothetical protein
LLNPPPRQGFWAIRAPISSRRYLTLALIGLTMSAVLAWPAYSFVFSRIKHPSAATLPWALVAVHAFALFSGPEMILGREMPYVALQLKNVPQGPWSALNSATTGADGDQALGTEALGRATAALGTTGDALLGRPSLGPAILFRKTAELALVRKTFELLRGDEAKAACSAIGIADHRFCEPAAIEHLLTSCPLVSAWALGTLFTELEKRALPQGSQSSAIAEDLLAAHHRAAFVTMARIAKTLRAASVPKDWPEAAFVAGKNPRPALFWDMERYELQSRRYWLRSMTERLENARKVLRAETQRLPASATESDSWVEAQALVDGLKADSMANSQDAKPPGRLRRWLLRLSNPAAGLPYALPNPTASPEA